jgi:hypothetical protein
MAMPHYTLTLTGRDVICLAVLLVGLGFAAGIITEQALSSVGWFGK